MLFTTRNLGKVLAAVRVGDVYKVFRFGVTVDGMNFLINSTAAQMVINVQVQRNKAVDLRR
ncbi:alpha/beta hydrolase [Mycobacterium lepromatosis]|uniref:alpha/beta hydrolase n=1 Tax=Mycobacterium lepromatosis TaxID=480418 RepID=UPI003D0627EC